MLNVSVFKNSSFGTMLLNRLEDHNRFTTVMHTIMGMELTFQRASSPFILVPGNVVVKDFMSHEGEMVEGLLHENIGSIYNFNIHKMSTQDAKKISSSRQFCKQ